MGESGLPAASPEAAHEVCPDQANSDSKVPPEGGHLQDVEGVEDRSLDFRHGQTEHKAQQQQPVGPCEQTQVEERHSQSKMKEAPDRRALPLRTIFVRNELRVLSIAVLQ